MTGILIFICAVILSTCVSHPFAHAREEEIIINLQSNETKILNSRNFHSWYDVDIVWHVRAPLGYRIMVEFEIAYYRYMYFVYVYDGITSENRSSDPREVLYGRSVPGNITTVGAYLWIRFIMDDLNFNRRFDRHRFGFRAVLTTVETTVIMLDAIETENISSPNFPANYDNNIDIALQLIAPSGYRVHVHFRHFESEANSDFVYIYEGWTSNFSSSTLRASLSGRSIPDNITSMGSYLWLRFASNERNKFKGFQALLNAKIPVGLIGQDSNVTSVHGTTGPTSTENSTATSSSSASSTGLSLVPILSSTLVPLFAVAIIVLLVCLLCRRKGPKHGSSQGIAASGEPRESPGIKDNPTFESSNVHDLLMAEVMGRHGGIDPYMALTTPRDGPTFQVYEPLQEVNSQGDVYEVPVNRANGQTGPEFGKTLHKLQVHPETDYENTQEYQGLTISVVERNYSRNESPIRGLQVQPETEYEVIHESEYMNVQ